MECTVLKTKPVSLAKALEKLDKFVARNAASQADALAAQQAAQQAAEQGEQDETARFMQHRINHLSPDVYHSLQLMRDAMRKEVEQQAKGEK